MAYLLMIDDNPQTQKYLGRIIRLRTRHQLGFAASATAAFEALAAKRPDLVFLDLYIPGMDGIELFETLRRHPATQTIPVFFHTAVPLDPVARMRLDRTQFEGLIEFPIEASALSAQIEAALESGRRQVRRWEPPPA